MRNIWNSQKLQLELVIIMFYLFIYIAQLELVSIIYLSISIYWTNEQKKKKSIKWIQIKMKKNNMYILIQDICYILARYLKIIITGYIIKIIYELDGFKYEKTKLKQIASKHT